jgi:DNA-binding MarR family transcriptional regulator
MINSIAAGQWELDIGTGILSLCPRSRKMFGLPPHVAEPIREEDWVPRVHSDDLPGIRQSLHASLVDRKIYAERFRAIRPDGSIREIFGVGRTLGDTADRCRFVGWNVDVVSSAHVAGELSWAPEGTIFCSEAHPSGPEQTETAIAEKGPGALLDSDRLLHKAEAILHLRRAGDRLLGRAMFKEPAFNLFLALYVLSAKQATVSLSSLAKAAGVPGTSACRWVAYLVDKGFVMRSQSITDRRAVSVCLTDSGRAVFNEFLAIR